MGHTSWDELPPEPRKTRPRLWPRSVGRLMGLVALAALALGVVVWGARPAAGPNRARPIRPVRPALPPATPPVEPGVPDDLILRVAPAGVDDRMVVAAPEGLDDAMIVVPRALALRQPARAPSPRLAPRRP